MFLQWTGSQYCIYFKALNMVYEESKAKNLSFSACISYTHCCLLIVFMCQNWKNICFH